MSRRRNAPGDGDFLGRWSARKLKARAEPAAPLPDAPPGPEAAQALPPGDARPEQMPGQTPGEAPGETPEKSDAEILQELGLPDPDSLTKGADFKAFMRAGVPARLRNRALRKLWLSDPVLANLDGLNDYDKDFTDAATVMPALKTAYKVGRGFLRDEPAAPPPAAAGAAPDASAAEAAAQAPVEAAPDAIAETAPEPPKTPESAAAPETDPSSPHAGEAFDEAGDDAGDDAGDGAGDGADSRPRRMRFRFEAG